MQIVGLRGKFEKISARRHLDSKFSKKYILKQHETSLLWNFIEIKWLWHAKEQVSVEFVYLLNVCELFLSNFSRVLKHVLQSLNYFASRSSALFWLIRFISIVFPQHISSKILRNTPSFNWDNSYLFYMLFQDKHLTRKLTKLNRRHRSTR